MQPGYSVEPVSREIFAELAPLMKDAFGDTVSQSYFDWKYLDNPSGPAIGNIARAADGEIAAFYGMIPEHYRFGPIDRRIYQSCDTMTHSRHRRKGLFQSLAKLTYENARTADPDFFAFGFGGPTSTPGFLKMGWRVEFELIHRFSPYPLTLVSFRGGTAGKARTLPGLSDDVVKMIAASGEGPNSVEKNEAFIRWRLANPQRRYDYLVDESSYAIFYTSGSNLFLFDFWEMDPGSGRNVWAAVLKASVERRLKGVITFCQPGTPFERRLQNYAMIRNPFGKGPASARIPFIAYGTQAGGMRAWNITPFDHDSY